MKQFADKFEEAEHTTGLLYKSIHKEHLQLVDKMNADRRRSERGLNALLGEKNDRIYFLNNRIDHMQRYIDNLEAKLQKTKEKKVEMDIKETKWSWEEPRRISMDGSKPERRFSLAGAKRAARKSEPESSDSSSSSGEENSTLERRRPGFVHRFPPSSGDSSTSEEEFQG